jgi:hypothetical protein
VSQLTSAEFQLQAFMVDNDGGERSGTEVPIELVNSRSLHLTPAGQAAPQSTYVWTLDDARMIGFPDIEERKAAKVFAIALSVQAWRFLHSPVILSTVSLLHIVRRGRVRTGLVGSSLRSAPITIDEDSFIEAASRLKTVWTMGGIRGKIMREAMNSYWDALHSVHVRSRFLSLWAALERAVNDDGVKRAGDRFDGHAASITSFSPGDIKPLRNLNNWLKHPDRVKRDEAETAAKKGVRSQTLKKLVDQSVSARLGFALSPTYDV